MTSYAIDSKAQALRATGIVEPVLRWVEDPSTGRRTQSKDQDRTEDNTFLWGVEVSYISESYGRQSTVIAKVTVPAPEQPAPAMFEVVDFLGLAVSVSVVKATGALREFWRAEGLAPAARKGAQVAA